MYFASLSELSSIHLVHDPLQLSEDGLFMLSGEWGANEELAEDGLFMSGEWTGNSENKVGIDEVCAIMRVKLKRGSGS